MANLNQLEKAFAKIEQIGRKEYTFYIDSTPIVFRPLADEDYVHVLKYCHVALEVGGEDGATQQDFIHRMKTATLAHAIVEVSGISLRDPHVETDDRLPDGRPVKREKVEVVREMLARWPQEFLTRVFACYGDMSTQVELEAERLIVYRPVDIDGEIRRLENRIADLHKEKEKAESRKADSKSAQVKAVLQVNQHEMESRRRLAQQQAAEASTLEDHIWEGDADSVYQGSGDAESSFLGDDPATDIIAQNAHILERRNSVDAQRRAAALADRAGADAVPAHRAQRRVPPHLAAAQVERSVTEAEYEGEVNGVPAYRLPTQTLSDRGRKSQPEAPGKPVVDQVSTGSVNTRFRPPR